MNKRESRLPIWRHRRVYQPSRIRVSDCICKVNTLGKSHSSTFVQFYPLRFIFVHFRTLSHTYVHFCSLSSELPQFNPYHLVFSGVNRKIKKDTPRSVS